MITHTISYWKSYKFKEFAKISHFEILKQILHETHLLKLFEKRYKYEMETMSIVEDTELTRFCPQTDRRTSWNQYNPHFNFVEEGSIKTGWETSARPLTNASENLAGRVENRPGRVEFCTGYIIQETTQFGRVAKKFSFAACKKQEDLSDLNWDYEPSKKPKIQFLWKWLVCGPRPAKHRLDR